MAPTDAGIPMDSNRIGSAPESLYEKAAVSVQPEQSEFNITTGDYGVESDRESVDVVIVTGADAANHLLPLRDDFDPAFTFRSILLASALSCFQAVVYQIYMVGYQSIKPSPDPVRPSKDSLI
jgi:hypothetical protein